MGSPTEEIRARTGSGYDSGFRDGRKAERQRCMVAVCPLCADGRPVEKRDGTIWHVSKPGGGGILLPNGPCHAQPIREMADEG